MVNVTLTRALTRALATKGRLAFAAAGGALVVLAAVLAATTGAPDRVLAGLIANAGFGFVVPVVTLLFAVAVLGDLVDDHTLVYLWLRPIARTTLATSALAATVVTAGGAVVASLALATLLGGRPELLVPAVVAGLLGAAAYGSVFVALGLRTSRSLLWGLAYVLLWEGLASNLTLAFARLSLRRYASSLFADLSSTGSVRFITSSGHAAVVLVAIVLVGVALTVWSLRTQDVA